MADASNEAPRPIDEEDDDTELLLAVATGILKNNAIRKLKLDYDKKVRKEKKKKYPNLDNVEGPGDDAREDCRVFIESILNLNCISEQGTHFTECSCLLSPKIHLEEAVNYIFFYSSLSKGVRETIIKEKILCAMERKNNAKGRQGVGFRYYSLPLSANKSDVPLCVQSFCVLLGIGKKREWRTLKASALSGLPGPVINKHKGNKRRASFPPFQEAIEGLRDFIENLANEHTEERATRLVRESLTTIERGDSHVVHLASSHTKRKLYDRYCYERGWIPGINGIWDHGKVHDYEQRDNDEIDWPIGSVPLPICSWWAFRSFWKKEFPNLRIRPPSEDICDECVIFANAFRYATSSTRRALQRTSLALIKSKENTPRADSSISEQSANSSGMNDDSIISFQEGGLDFDTSESETEDDDSCSRFSRVSEEAWSPKDDWDERDGNKEAEALLEKAKIHVLSAQAMREFARQMQQKATSDSETCVPRELATKCMVYDYSQNMQLPWYGGQQPGKVYYCVPKNVFCFGCANLSVDPVVMATYSYCEEIGNKGGNNVSSLVLHDMDRRGYLSFESTGKEYVLLFDNCGGQNKNRMVLRLALYLVEAGFYEKVMILFYIKGHTKNACDRLFNEMKREVRKSNVYTFTQLLEKVNQSPYIQGNSVTEDVFVDVCEMLDSFYKQIAPGTITKNHIFWVEKNAPTTLHMKEWTEGLADSQNLIRGAANTQEKKESMRSYAFKRLKPPGLSELKQVDLYLKYRPFVPPEHQDDICPRPSDEIMEKVKKERNEKQRGKAADKRALQSEVKAESKTKSDEEKKAKKTKVAAEKAAKEAAKEAAKQLKAQQKIKAAEEKAAKEAAKQVKAQQKVVAAEERARKVAAKKAAATPVSAAASTSVVNNRVEETRACCSGDECRKGEEEEEPEYFCYSCGGYSHYACHSIVESKTICNKCASGV